MVEYAFRHCLNFSLSLSSSLVMPILARKFYNLFPAYTSNTSAETFVLLYSLSPASSTLLPLASRYAVAPNLVSKLSAFPLISERAWVKEYKRDREITMTSFDHVSRQSLKLAAHRLYWHITSASTLRQSSFSSF